jgi:hypothetical protein
MRRRWLIVALVASLCLNVAVVGTFVVHRVRRAGLRHFQGHGLTPEVRENLRKVRDAALPEFAALADKVQSTDSLLWAEMRSESPDSVRVESLCQELGRIHGKMRAMVFRQMHRELQLMPASARADYLQHMMMMRPGLPFGGHHASGEPGRGMGRHMHGGSMMPTPRKGGTPPAEPPTESGD